MKKLLTVLAAVMTAAVTQILVPYSALAQSVAGAYIESDGTQEIDLGFAGSSSMTIELEFAFLGGDTGDYQAVFGSRAGTWAKNISLMRMAGEKSLTGDCNNGNDGAGSRMGPVSVAENTRYRAALQGGKWTLTDVHTGSVIGAAGHACFGEEFVTPGNMKLFSIDGVTINGTTWARAKARVYSLVVKDATGNTLHNFEPRRNKDGVAGLYDTVAASEDDAWKFPKEGGDPLTYGPAVEVSREATVNETTAQSSASVTVARGQGGTLTTIVCPVDSAQAYIESDGTQEIDLGFVGSSSMTIELEFAFLGGNTGDYQAVFGSRRETYGRNVSLLYAASEKKLTGDCNNGNDGAGSRMGPVSVAENTRYRAALQGGKWTLTDVHTGSVIGAAGHACFGEEFVTPGNMKLFSIDGVTINGTTWARAKARVYSLVVKDATGDTLHNFEPRRNKDGVAGLYDTVAASEDDAWKFPKEGGDPLTYGPAVALESDGTQEIDLGFAGSSSMTIELEFAFLGGNAGDYQAVFGSRRETWGQNVSLLYTASEKKLTGDCNNGNSGGIGNRSRMGPVAVDEGTRYRATLQAGKWTLTDAATGSEVGTSQSAWGGGEFTTPGNMKLFSIDGVTINGSTWARAKARVYSLVVRDAAGNTLHNFEPRRRKDGAAGLYDTVAASEDDAWKVSNSGNPLALIGASSFAPDAPWAYTNVVGHIAESGTIPVTLSPLKPGTTYTWRAFIDDGKATDLSSLAAFTTAADQAPAGATLSLHAEVVFGAAKDGHLRLVLTRENTASAAAVTLIWGKAYGGADAGAWENTAKVGTFAAGEKTVVVNTPLLAKDTNYLRAYTADGEWSTTVFVPETGFVPGKAGLFIVVR